MKKILIIAAFLILSFYTEKTYACTCIETPLHTPIEIQVAEAYQNSYAVFSATVISIQKAKTPNRNNKITLRLGKSWKGNFGKSITIITSSTSGMCGYPFKKGITYLIYAFGPRKELSTSICTRTAEIASNKDVAVLDGLKNKP